MNSMYLKPAWGILFLLPSFFNNLSAQNLTIDFTPLDAVCSYDPLSCAGEVVYPFSLSVEDTTGLEVSHGLSTNAEIPVSDDFGSLSGNYPDYSISGDYPIGNYTFVVTAIQGSDTLVADMPFSVVDCLAPAVECLALSNLDLVPQPDGCCAFVLWATDVVSESTENCSSPLTFSIHKTNEISNGTDTPSLDQVGIIIDCNDYNTSPTVEVTLYAWDNAFNPYSVQPDGTVGGPNYTFCESEIFIINQCDFPPDLYTIGGVLQTEEAEGIANVEVFLSDSVLDTVYTAADGSYYFNDLPEGGLYSISVQKDDDHLNGVSVFDVVLMTKHILGTQLLDSPFKILAADVNNSESVTISDLIAILNLILGNTESFPNNTSWKFIDANYVFPDPTNPWTQELPEVLNINVLNQNYLNENFIGIKIGDVNNSAIPN